MISVIGTKSKKDTSYDSGALSPVILTLNFSPVTYFSIPSGLKMIHPCLPYPTLFTLKYPLEDDLLNFQVLLSVSLISSTSTLSLTA